MIDRSSYVPLYIQIRKDIEEKILSGEIKIGDKLMSESQMLRYYNVGRMTIRNALAELVSSGCVRKEKGLGTYCVMLPQTQTPKNVHVLLNMRDTYFAPYFLTGISRVLNANDCNLLLYDSEDSMDSMAQLLNRIMESGTDGIILQPYTGTEPVSPMCREAILRCQDARIPLIAIDGKFQNIDTACLMNDDDYGGKIATQHAIEMGHRRILGLFRNMYKDSKYREAGYRLAMQEAGLEPLIVDADETSFDEIRSIIASERITAIVCYNDLLAVDCYHNFNRIGLKIAEDISVIGYDDTELSISSLPRITSITHPKDTMGEMAAEKLLEMMDGNIPGQFRYVFKPNLVSRDSVKNLNAG